jgi:hypothetical protein
MEYFTAIWYNLRPFGIVWGHSVIIFPVLVCLNQQKSGSPGHMPTFIQGKNRSLKQFSSPALSGSVNNGRRSAIPNSFCRQRQQLGLGQAGR